MIRLWIFKLKAKWRQKKLRQEREFSRTGFQELKPWTARKKFIKITTISLFMEKTERFWKQLLTELWQRFQILQLQWQLVVLPGATLLFSLKQPLEKNSTKENLTQFQWINTMIGLFQKNLNSKRQDIILMEEAIANLLSATIRLMFQMLGDLTFSRKTEQKLLLKLDQFKSWKPKKTSIRQLWKWKARLLIPQRAVELLKMKHTVKPWNNFLLVLKITTNNFSMLTPMLFARRRQERKLKQFWSKRALKFQNFSDVRLMGLSVPTSQWGITLKKQCVESQQQLLQQFSHLFRARFKIRTDSILVIMNIQFSLTSSLEIATGLTVIWWLLENLVLVNPSQQKLF